MNEQVTQESSFKSVQTVKKKRSPEEKHGRQRWILTLLERISARLDGIEEAQDIILNGLKQAGYFHFDVPFIQKVACVDAVDLNIVEVVREAGAKGVFPKDVAKKVNAVGAYDLKYYDVSRRIVRMNKRLKKKSGELLFEKRGQKWALTSFAFDTYGETEEEVARSKSVPEEEV
ncbi:MAG TPA: hypothetical protein VI864_02710 [Candidatus Bathyarchaeia archaeon]|nr:hypothetical protein [Candidatus Bathyarchaeia archaeon]